MSDFTRRVPSSAGELKTNLNALHENVKYVEKIFLDASSGHLNVDLSWKANSFGGDKGADFYMPIRRDKFFAAEELAKRILSQSRSGFPPSDADAEQLFSYIDPLGN